MKILDTNPFSKYRGIETVEDLLDQEIMTILSKKKILNNNKDSSDYSTHYNNIHSHLTAKHNNVENERYLPFEADEIKPTPLEYNNGLKKQIAASIMPIIEDWLHYSLEDIINKAIDSKMAEANSSRLTSKAKPSVRSNERSGTSSTNKRLDRGLDREANITEPHDRQRQRRSSNNETRTSHTNLSSPNDTKQEKSNATRQKRR